MKVLRFRRLKKTHGLLWKVDEATGMFFPESDIEWHCIADGITYADAIELVKQAAAVAPCEKKDD